MTNRRSPKTAFAKKSLGQNFLVDPTIINAIIDALELQAGETIIEIGAGRGALTRELVQTEAQIIAIELDRDLIPILQTEFANFPNFKIIEADALETNFAEIIKDQRPKTKDQRPKLVANLPYYISTAILQRLIEQRENFSELTLMLQREVVERITAAPNNSERGFLTVFIEAFAAVEKLFDVPPMAFRPVPKIWSSVVKIKFHQTSLITASAESQRLFKSLISTGFAQKRKTILNNLKSAPAPLSAKISEQGGALKLLETSEIAAGRRAESLTLSEWLKLLSVFDSVERHK